jgi:hypothetical protein
MLRGGQNDPEVAAGERRIGNRPRVLIAVEGHRKAYLPEQGQV